MKRSYRDEYGDVLTVETFSGSIFVSIKDKDSGDESCVQLTPAKADLVVNALLLAIEKARRAKS